MLLDTPAEGKRNRILQALERPDRLVPLPRLRNCVEGGGGKIKLLNAGAYRDHAVDISLISHPTNGPDTALASTAAFAQFTEEYFGKGTRAAARHGRE